MSQAELIKAAAQCWHELGLTVIPFKIFEANENGIHDKKPAINEYSHWYSTPQTDAEFNALNWNGCNGYGVILGMKANNGLYLGCIDWDPKFGRTKPTPDDKKYTDNPTQNNYQKDLAEYEKALEEHPKAKEIGRKILKSISQATKVEETVNKGLHYFYWSEKQPKTNSVFHDQTTLELLGEGKLCVMYPSTGYVNVGSDVIAMTEDLEQFFYKYLKDAGFLPTEQAEIENQVDKFSFKIEKIIDTSGFKNKGNGQYEGPHPIHGSDKGHNFSVDVKKNIWHCFRHDSGGGALQFLAVKEGLIKCEQAKKGALRGKKFHDTLKLAVANGLIDQSVLNQAEINPVILAKDIMEDYRFIVDRATNELYRYVDGGADEGIYKLDTEQIIKREITKRLDENFKARYYNEVKEFITGISPLIDIDTTDPELLAVSNGLLNVTTGKIEKFTSDHHITSKLQVTFNPTIQTTDWDNFLTTVIPKAKQRRQLQQLVGHCLIKKILTELCAVLLGGGSNGKTITLLILTKFLGGPNNVSSHSIQSLCYDRFVTGELKGKLANICADLPHKELQNTAIFRSLVSGDWLQAYRKHIQKTTAFKPYAKFIFSANQIPVVTTEEDCYAWYRRFIFIDFSVTFTKENSIPRQELIDKLSKPETQSEILNWALQGLADLIKEGDITDKPTVEEVRLIYIQHSDSALAYFAEQCQATNDPNDIVFTSSWYREYITYCNNKKLKAKTQGEFTNMVKKHFCGAEKCRIDPNKGTNTISAYRYVKTLQGLASLSPSNYKAFGKKKDSDGNLPLLERFFDTEKLPQKPDKPANPDKEPAQDENVLVYQRVSPKTEPHECDNPNCDYGNAILAEFKSPKEEGWVYVCPDCFKLARTNAESKGVKFVEQER